MAESETPEKESSVKWAREAFEFLKLFRREQRQISGLLLLEIGWALLLVLVAKLSAADSEPMLGVPWPWDHWHARQFPLSTVFLVGALAVAGLWFFSSGLFLCLRLIVWRLLWYPLVLLSYAVALAAFVVTLPVLLLGMPIEQYRIKHWEATQTKYDRAKLAALKKDKRDVFLQLARDATKFRADWLTNWVGDLYASVMIGLSSGSSLGLATLYSYSYDEDEKAAKAPMQILATAMGRLQIKLRSLPSLHYIRFRILPPIVTVTNSQKARFVRRLLGLDAALWGSYLSTDPPRIWLNIELPPTGEKIDDKHKLVRSSEVDPFHAYPEIDPAIEVNQSEMWEVYVALLITLLQVLQVRQARKFTLYPKGVDRLYYSYSDRDAILTNLVKDALFSMPHTAAPVSEYPTAKDVLVSVAGSWIGKQLGGLIREDYSSNYELLRSVASRCVELHPDDSGGYYRLAALQCLLKDADGAEKTLAIGISKDQALQWIGWTQLSAWAGLAIHDLDSPLGDEAVRTAKAVVYCARAVAAGGEYARKSLRKDLEKTSFHLFATHRAEDRKELPSADVLLLYRTLGMPAFEVATTASDPAAGGGPPTP